ncbi:MAG: sigma-70 family RNA polymerase sigma factor [Lachnospiraceae bacterium]|nr:sigma-70 family RNA polymerase sigma factor [Lachnospiraceae bacterium]
MDQDIIELLAAKDQKAIELTAERYGKLLRYIIASILGEREENVEECLNDVYLKLWTKGQGYDYTKASLKTYLKVIARNTALNSLRQRKRLEEMECMDMEDTLRDDYIDYSQNVENRVVLQEEVRALERVLKKLKKKDRELVLRRYYYLQSVKQIAAAMEMSENALNSRLSRLRGKLKESYEKEVAR